MRRALAIAGLTLIAGAAQAEFIGWVGVPLIVDDSGTIPVPNVIGEANAAAAEAEFEAVGLDIGATTARCSDETVDEVVGQDPAPGVLVAPAALVDVLVSNGVECPSGIPGVRPRGLSIGL